MQALFVAVAAILATWFTQASPQETQPPAPMAPVPSAAPAQASQPAETIEPQAVAQLRRMSDFLAKQDRFSYKAELDFDLIEEDGHKVLMTRVLEVTLVRPNKVYARSRGFGGPSEFFYDGAHVTLVDPHEREFSRVATPDKIDAMLDQMGEQYELSVPTSDLLSADVYHTLTRFVESGRYVGQVEVGGEPCHHLAFEQELVDWQVWISAGDQPLPRRLLLNYKFEPGCPMFMARIVEWNIGGRVATVPFQFSPPSGFREVPLERVDQPEGPAPAQQQPPGNPLEVP